MELERVYPSKSPSNKNNSNSNAGASQSKPSSVQSSSKTTTFSSVSNVKSVLQVTELQLMSSSGKITTALILCDIVAVTLGCPMILKIDLVCTVQHLN